MKSQMRKVFIIGVKVQVQYGAIDWKQIVACTSVCQVCSGSHSSSRPVDTLPLPSVLCCAWLRAFREAAPFASSSVFTTACPSAAHMASASSRSCEREKNKVAIELLIEQIRQYINIDVNMINEHTQMSFLETCYCLL